MIGLMMSNQFGDRAEHVLAGDSALITTIAGKLKRN